MKYTLLILLITLSGCKPATSPETTETRASTEPSHAINTFDGAWFSNVLDGSLGDYKCLDLRKINLTEVSKQSLFANILLDRYQVVAIYKSSWYNYVDPKAKDEIVIYWAKFEDKINAFGIYASLDKGLDQTALRGGTSKRLGKTLIGLKDNWVMWTALVETQSKITIFELEPVFAGLYQKIPGGNWMKPEPIRSLESMDPKPLKIEVIPQGYMGIADFGMMTVAKYSSKNGPVELFGTNTSDFETNKQQFDILVKHLRKKNLTAVILAKEGQKSLFLAETSLGPLYVVLSQNSLKGVRGISNVLDAQALLARWED